MCNQKNAIIESLVRKWSAVANIYIYIYIYGYELVSYMLIKSLNYFFFF